MHRVLAALIAGTVAIGECTPYELDLVHTRMRAQRRAGPHAFVPWTPKHSARVKAKRKAAHRERTARR